MSRQWPVGDIATQSLEEIVRGAALARLRRQIYDDVWQPKITATPCSPAFCHQTCGPDLSCPCEPLPCQQSCAPWDAHTLPAQ